MLRNIRKVIRQLRCSHTHTFTHYLPNDTPWCYKGEFKGKHSGLAIRGCYLCGKVWCLDWQA